MRWRDIRFEKPTKADADKDGEVLVFGELGKATRSWNCFDRVLWTYWAPLPELPDPPERTPDPPEGWRFVEAGDVDRRDVQWWDSEAKTWKDCGAWSAGFPFDKGRTYIVPVDPPTPPELKYRPYNAAELKLLIGKVVDGINGYRAMITGCCGDAVFCQGQKVSAEALLKDHVWADGNKCGVKIE